MSKIFKLSELIIDNENPHYVDEKRLREDKSKKIREVSNNGIKRHLTWIENPKDIKSITTPTGKELTPEELFDFVIGDNITDLVRSQNRNTQKADIAIVLGNAKLLTTRERAIRQFKKALHNSVQLTVCPSTLDLERYESIKSILSAPEFDENAFRKELKRIYCTEPELTQMLREEVGHTRNVFIRGEIDEPSIKTFEEEKER